MKYLLAKPVLLSGALSLLLSTVPVRAAEETLPLGVEEEVATKQEHHAGWTKEARHKRLEGLRKELDSAWGSFMKCFKKGEKCPAKVKTVVGILTSILALVGVGTVAEKWAPKKYKPTALYGKARESVGPKVGEVVTKARGLTKKIREKVTKKSKEGEPSTSGAGSDEPKTQV